MKKVIKQAALSLLSAVMIFGCVAPVNARAFSEEIVLEESFESEENPILQEENIDIPEEDIEVEQDLETEEAFIEEEPLEEEVLLEEAPAVEEDAADAVLLEDNKIGDDITFTFNSSTGELRLSGTGSTYDYTLSNRPFKDLKGVKKLTVDAGITRLGSYVLCVGSAVMEKISLPNTLKEIGDYALFYATGNKIEVVIPGSVEKFGESCVPNYCFVLKFSEGITRISPKTISRTRISTLILPESLLYIDEYGLSGSTIFYDFSLPKNLKSVGDHAFERLFDTEILTFTGDLPTFGNDCFDQDYMTCYYPAGNSTWTREAVENLTNSFEEVTWVPSNYSAMSGKCGDNITWKLNKINHGYKLVLTGSGEMEDYSPNHQAPWSYLRKEIMQFSMDDRITYAGSYAFYNLYMNVNGTGHISKGLKKVGNHAFACTNLTSTNFPTSVTYFGDYCFYDCCYLSGKGTTFNPDTTYIGDHAFERSNDVEAKLPKFTKIEKIGDNAFYNSSKIQGSLEFPDTLTYVGDYAFCSCKNLSGKLVLPENLSHLGKSAFKGLGNISGDITISENITEIPEDVFAGTGITSVNISGNVTTIGRNAFKDCTSLEKYVFTGPMPKKIQNTAFNGAKANPTVYFPNAYPEWYTVTADMLKMTDLNPTFVGTGEVLYFTVNYYNEDGTLYHAEKVKAGDKASKPANPSKGEYWDFVGWKSGEKLYDFSKPVITDIDLTASFKRDTYTVTMKLLNGEFDKKETPLKGEKLFDYIRNIKPYKKGYLFTGWSFEKPVDGTETELIDEDYIVLKDITIYAVYREETHEDVEAAIPLSKVKVSGITAKNYAGRAIKQDTLTLTYKKTVLIEGADYKVSYTNNVNKGTAKVTITGINGYKGTLTKSFTIKAKAITKDNLKVYLDDEYNYTKGGAAPEPAVYCDGRKLYFGKDYSLSYAKNKKPGKAVITVTGKGNYKSSVKENFTVIHGLTSSWEVNVSEVAYNKNANKMKPKVTITENGKLLKQGTDYTVDYSRAAADQVVTVIPKGNYAAEGNADIEKSFRVYTVSISKATVTTKPRTYTGYAISNMENYIDVTYGGETLKYGVDYLIIGYKNNVKPGKAKVTIQGLGTYGGTKTVTFKIVKNK